MPYPGIKDEDTQRMEDCVMKVMKQGKDKGSAIAICHKSIAKSETSDPLPEDISAVDGYMKQCMQKMMGKGETSEDARKLCLKAMEKAEYDIEKAEFILDMTLFKA